jgi:indolepyruvate ferredoxin oxidoreductase
LFDLADEPVHEQSFPRTYEELRESRAARLVNYQDAAWAAKYTAFLDEVEVILDQRGLGKCGAFMAEVAASLGKLMAYKDEYEVARLYTDPAYTASLRDTFGGDFKLRIHLAPPLLPLGKDQKTGRPRKIALPGWAVFPLFRVLARLKGLRGGTLDIFGHTAERRMERALIGEYMGLVRDVAVRMTPETMHAAIELAAAPELVSGYGPVKDAGVEAYRARIAELLPQLDDTATAPSHRADEPA